MSDIAGNAHQIDVQKLNHALNGKITRCPACNQVGTLSVLPTIMELREYHDGDFVVGSIPIVPLAVLTCQNCGNSLLINALVAGLINNNTSGDNSNGAK